jgi:hypothetical protein
MTCYLEPTWEAGRAFAARQLQGSVVMLNLLRFRDVADYSATPELAPPRPIRGAEAFQRYIEHTLPYLRRTSHGSTRRFASAAFIGSSVSDTNQKFRSA